jgi:hypothetical protein
MGKKFPAGVKKGGRGTGHNIWSRQMEYASMRNMRVRVPGKPKEIIVPQYTPPTPEVMQKILKVPKFSVEIETDGLEPLVIHRTSRKEADKLVHSMKHKMDNTRMIRIKKFGTKIYEFITGKSYKIETPPEMKEEI